MLTGLIALPGYIYRQQGLLPEGYKDVPRYIKGIPAIRGNGGATLFTLDLPKDIEKRLLVLAMHTGRTVQFCAREAILDYIDEVEERFLAIDRIGEEEPGDAYDLLD